MTKMEVANCRSKRCLKRRCGEGCVPEGGRGHFCSIMDMVTLSFIIWISMPSSAHCFPNKIVIHKMSRLGETGVALPDPAYLEAADEPQDMVSPTTFDLDHDTIFAASDPNDNRYAASDWFQNMKSIPKSTILASIKGPVLVVVAWSTMVSSLHKISSVKGWTNVASNLSMSSKPHSFLVSALGLLLVFRTNSAYQRFAEGRKIWERIHSESRNLSRLAILYQNELGDARLKRIFRLLAAYPYLLHQHIQPQSDPSAKNKPYGLILPDRRGFRTAQKPTQHSETVLQLFPRRRSNNDKNEKTAGRDTAPRPCWVDQRKLPWCLFPPQALDRCVHSSNRPLWVCDRLSCEITQAEYTDNFTSRERLQFLSQIGRLSQAIGQCERIHQTAVPLNYARHSLRSLTLWLFTLPFALVKEFGLVTGPVMGFAAWLLYGIYQIGYTIEDPFQGSLRLNNLCDAICRDVMYGTNQMDRRLSAFGSTEMLEWAQLDAQAIGTS
eukprot:CAMPEP_0168731388 /NCGR_PEP_ID=MMETSP0724-20121128/7227_1 /TAXON_ID=265536 /ORGANISM="Amphiprora sp., Strain CCMP467" /LENGTH=494 /DNA_ID=CAMNT_0008778369 /DNA_START=62 /DNA_END=1543 /DNA_ORIENTATION=-